MAAKHHVAKLRSSQIVFGVREKGGENKETPHRNAPERWWI